MSVARRAVARHPRHALLFAFVGGLLGAVAWPSGILVLALSAALLAGPRALGAGMSVAVLLGGAVGLARLAAVDAAPLLDRVGRPATLEVTALEPARIDRHRTARQRAGVGALGAVVLVLRGGRDGLAIGQRAGARGLLRALGPTEEFQGRRGARVALEVEALEPRGARGGAAGAVDAVRRRSEAAFARGAPPAQAALLDGLVLGQDHGIATTVQDEFRRAGLAHLTAASGSNVLLLTLLVASAGAVLGVRRRTRLLAALALIALYVPLAGAGPSIQRAGVMGAAGVVAAFGGRGSSRAYAIALAAAVTLVWQPHAAAEPGWQLSFAAVVALGLWAPPLRDRLRARGWPSLPAEGVAVTLAATLGTAPLMALHFGQVSVASLPANVAAAPAVAPVMWIGSLAAAAGQLSPTLGGALAALAAPFAGYVGWVAHVAARLPGAAASVHASVAAAAVAYAIPLALPRLLARARGRRVVGRAVGLGALGAAIGALALALAGGRSGPPLRAPDELVVSFLDVGQGDATLLQHGRHAVLVDTGPAGGPILRRLREAGVDRLDALLVTHAQADHEGAVPAVLEAVGVATVLDGGAGWTSPAQGRVARLPRGRVIVPAAGQRVSIGPLALRVLWPPAPVPGTAPSGDPNRRAVVTELADGGFRMLLPADAESDVLLGLTLRPVDVLKVSHHGSDDPGLPELLSRLRPRVAAIEVGAGNPYGHPRRDTLAALATAVPHVYRTDRDGTVRLHVRAGRMWVDHGRL